MNDKTKHALKLAQDYLLSKQMGAHIIAAIREALAEQPEYASENETEELLKLNDLPEPLRLAAMLEKTLQWPLHGKAADCLRRLHAALAEQPAQQQDMPKIGCVNHDCDKCKAQQQEPVAWCPDVCPITGLPFFMWIEHHETGQMVPTYGGPYDSYTIPVRDKDGSYCRERYDHDRGGWLTDEIEDVGIQIVSDQAYVSDEAPPASKPWVGLTQREKDLLLGASIHTQDAIDRTDTLLREKNA